MANYYQPDVVFQPRTYRGFQRGINQIINAIRPTLGPRPRVVAIDRILDKRMPELLDCGGVIARRIIQLPGRDEDVGAMFIRDVLWRLQDQTGDGTATAAVLFQKIYNEGGRYITSGGNAIRLRSALEGGLKLIIEQLTQMTGHVTSKAQLTQLAETICYDRPLAELMGEIFEIIGPYGRLEIRPGRGRELEREYVEGMYWERGLFSREMIADHSRARSEFENAAILISDLDIQEPQQLFPALELALRSELRSLLIVANKISDNVIGFLLANKKPEKFQVIAVQTPGWDRADQAAALEDLATLTGGRPFIKVAGDTFNTVKPSDFGHARRVWADMRNFGLVGGKGNARRLRQHLANLQTAYERSDELVVKEKLLARIGKLLGGSATLWVGSATELEINRRVELAERTAVAMRGAMQEGVLPGGGIALLACQPALQSRLQQAADADERAAYHILTKAVMEPLRTIVTNAGYDPHEVLAQLNLASPGHGFDVTQGKVVDLVETGLCDAAATVKAAVFSAIAGAALALTIDVIIHRRDQPRHAAIATPGKRKQL